MRSKFTSASRSPHVFFFGTIFKPVKFRPGVNVPIPQLLSIRCVVCVCLVFQKLLQITFSIMHSLILRNTWILGLRWVESPCGSPM